MFAVLFKIPNDNFMDLYAKTFHSDDEMHDWIINACDIEVLSTKEIENTLELENIMIDWLDCVNPLWKLDGVNYWINRF